MPYLDRAILGSRDDDRQFWVIARKGDITSVAFECRDQRLCCVIPNFDSSVIRGGEQIWLVGLRVVVNVIDTFRFVRL